MKDFLELEINKAIHFFGLPQYIWKIYEEKYHAEYKKTSCRNVFKTRLSKFFYEDNLLKYPFYFYIRSSESYAGKRFAQNLFDNAPYPTREEKSKRFYIYVDDWLFRQGISDIVDTGKLTDKLMEPKYEYSRLEKYLEQLVMDKKLDDPNAVF